MRKALRPVENRASSRRRVITRVAIACLIVLLGLWAFRPLPHSLGGAAVPEERVEVGLAAPLALDQAAFSAPLWVVPAPPAAPAPPPPPPPPPPPIRWQLLAVVVDGAAPRALIYDADSNRVVSLAAGDALGPRRVTRVGRRSVDVRDSAGERTLTLGAEGGGVRP